MKPNLPKGTRDFLPEQMARRRFVIDTIKATFERYGFGPLETPSIEKLDVLSGKYGEEGEQLIFKVLRRGTGLEKLGRDLKEFVVHDYRDLIDEALRYDLTVPLSRVVAMYERDLVFPFKRYQIQPVWRADRPQRGRFREFYQCDIDTVGTDSMLADAEAIAVIDEVLTALGFRNFKIRLNNRKILNGILEHAGIDPTLGNSVFIAIDKLDKIGMDGVKKELLDRGISDSEINKIFTILEIQGSPAEVLDRLTSDYGDITLLREGADELHQITESLPALGVADENCRIDLFLVRGLGYYTGPIFESVVEEPKVGSLTGGGRYDKLIGMFSGRDIPATGTSFGIERIIEVMQEFDMFPGTASVTQVLVAVFDETVRAECLAFARDLRKRGVTCEAYLDTVKLKKQFTYADRKRIPFVCVIGPDEAAAKQVTIKDLGKGTQTTVSREQAVRFFD